MKQYATSLILWASLLVNEVHTLFAGSAKMVTVPGGQVPLQWYVWLLGNSLWGIMISAAVILYRDNRINRASVRAYGLFCVIDLAMFLINFKQYGYASIYTMLLIGWILIYNYGTANRKGNINAVEW